MQIVNGNRFGVAIPLSNQVIQEVKYSLVPIQISALSSRSQKIFQSFLATNLWNRTKVS